MKSVFCLMLILFVVGGMSSCRQTEEFKTIGNEEFSALLKNENTILLDVRTPEEYAEGHLENAVLLDYKNENFQTELNKLDHTKTYLVYCKAGGRSAKASEALSKKGFNTYNLDGGISSWTGKVVH